MTSAVPSSLRRLSMIARSASSRLAYARARSAPPASGDTIVTGPEVLARQVLDDHRRREQVIDRDVKEPLNLRLVQIHRQHPVRAGRAQQVRHELRRNRHARLVLPILPRVSVVRNHRRDPRRRRPAKRVDHHAELHQVLVDRCRGRLDDEDIGAADVLVDLERDLAVGKPMQPRGPERHAEMLGDLPRQRGMRASGEELQRTVSHLT